MENATGLFFVVVIAQMGFQHWTGFTRVILSTLKPHTHKKTRERRATYHPDDHSRTDSHRFPCDASSAADDATYAMRVVKVRPVHVSEVARAWSCTIVESYWG